MTSNPALLKLAAILAFDYAVGLVWFIYNLR